MDTKTSITTRLDDFVLSHTMRYGFRVLMELTPQGFRSRRLGLEIQLIIF